MKRRKLVAGDPINCRDGWRYANIWCVVVSRGCCTVSLHSCVTGGPKAAESMTDKPCHPCLGSISLLYNLATTNLWPEPLMSGSTLMLRRSVGML